MTEEYDAIPENPQVVPERATYPQLPEGYIREIKKPVQLQVAPVTPQPQVIQQPQIIQQPQGAPVDNFSLSEVERLQKEIETKKIRIGQAMQERQLKGELQRLNQQEKDLFPRWNFNKDKLKFWLIAGVCAIAGALIVSSIINKFI